MDLLYFEPQRRKMCAQHALNMLFQGNYFTEESLVIIAQELDDRERAMLNPQAEAQFKSHNFDETGYFSIQVIMEAIRRHADITITPLDSPTQIKIRDNPSSAKAYICNMEEHWFTIRKIAGAWFILDSLNKAPRIISQFHMTAYITQLCKQGDLPACAADTLPNDYWIDRAGTKKLESDIERAIALSLKDSAQTSTQTHPTKESKASDKDDVHLHEHMPVSSSHHDSFDVQKALEESLKDVQQNFDVDTVEALQLNEAIQNSLVEAATSSSSSHLSMYSGNVSKAKKPPPK